MLKKFLQITFFMLLLSTSFSAHATTIACENLKGAWYGTYTDTGKLFADGGPWAIVMYLDYQNGHFVGNVISTDSIPPKNSHVWGECQNGQLKNIYFLSTPQQCGVPSAGTLTSDNKMQIQFNWKNPAGPGSTTFNLNLNRADQSYQQKTEMFLQNFLQGKAINISQGCL